MEVAQTINMGLNLGDSGCGILILWNPCVENALELDVGIC
jgi:hypothetical protein